MRTFLLTIAYVFFFNMQQAIPLDAGLLDKPKAKAPEWVCLYNVGPNADMGKPGVKKACSAYAAKVQHHMDQFKRSQSLR